MRKGKRIRDKLYWTPVEVALPENYGLYIVTTKSVVKPDYEGMFAYTNYRVYAARFNPGTGFWKLVGDDSLIYFSVYKDPEIIAWAPLPGAYVPKKLGGKK